MEAMDFMDPRRRHRHATVLAIGYVLIGIALLLLTTILVFIAYGFGLKDGRVIQSGLVFLSSSPSPAQVFIDNKRYANDTNTKLTLPEGTYHVALKRNGYRDWNRVVNVQGGKVESFSYPFLFPSSLTTTTLSNYAVAPLLATESLDQHWLLISRPSTYYSYDLYDLTDSRQLPTVVDLGAGLFTASTGSHAISAVAWANDNTHILLSHKFAGNTEYILVNRNAPELSVNLSQAFSLPATGITMQLQNARYDQYYVYDQATHQLSRATLGTPTLAPYISSVLTFAATGDRMVLYVTPDPTDPHKVDLNLFDGTTTYVVRRDSADMNYVLSLTTYNNDLYAAFCSPKRNGGLLYKNPIAQINNAQLGAAIPATSLHIASTSYISFSANGQYVLFANGNKIATYDIENDENYIVTLPDSLDSPQLHASWMDAARLTYIHNGQIFVIDYDGQNRQALISADPNYPLFYSQSYKTLYALVGATDRSHELLTSTSLRTVADQ